VLAPLVATRASAGAFRRGGDRNHGRWGL